MACIISRNSLKLFISYAPGTGSSSLEQHLRTHDHLLRGKGFDVVHYPADEFSQDEIMSRHVCYAEYLSLTGNTCNYIATGIRNPFNYYFAEYNRILSKWSKLLDDKNSWIYQERSKSTLELTLKTNNNCCFNTWFFDILIGSLSKGYLLINEDHLDQATHFIKSEEMTESFDLIGQEIFSISFSDLIGPFPRVNTSNYYGHYASHITQQTKKLALALFGYYLNKYEYSYEELSNKFDIGHANKNVLEIDTITFINNREVIQGQLLEISIDFCLKSSIEQLELKIQILDGMNRLAFSKTSISHGVTPGRFYGIFHTIANLPVGNYVVEFVFSEQLPSGIHHLGNLNTPFEIHAASMSNRGGEGYANLPSSISIGSLAIPCP